VVTRGTPVYCVVVRPVPMVVVMLHAAIMIMEPRALFTWNFRPLLCVSSDLRQDALVVAT